MDPTNSGGHLLSFVERIERLHDDKKAIEDDIKEVYAEAKGTGFDTKIIREVVKRRGKDHAELTEHEAILELYLKAISDAQALRDSVLHRHSPPTPTGDPAGRPSVPSSAASSGGDGHTAPVNRGEAGHEDAEGARTWNSPGGVVTATAGDEGGGASALPPASDDEGSAEDVPAFMRRR